MARRRKRRNRKKRVDGFIFPTSFAGVLVFVSVLALSYLWLCSRCEELGREIKTLEGRQAELAKKLLNEEYKWTRMKAPGNIETALRRTGLAMTWPRRDQVVWLADARIQESPALQQFEERTPRLAGVRRVARHE
jgi:hypothetical protein